MAVVLYYYYYWRMVVVLLLFGGKNIPELMRGLGKGMRDFKYAKYGNEPKDDK